MSSESDPSPPWPYPWSSPPQIDQPNHLQIAERMTESILTQLSLVMRPVVQKQVMDLLAWNQAFHDSEKDRIKYLEQIQNTEEGDRLLAHENRQLKEELRKHGKNWPTKITDF